MLLFSDLTLTIMHYVFVAVIFLKIALIVFNSLYI